LAIGALEGGVVAVTFVALVSSIVGILHTVTSLIGPGSLFQIIISALILSWFFILIWIGFDHWRQFGLVAPLH